MTGVVPIIPVGLGDTERQRLTRVVRSLFRHEPDLPAYVVIHDGVDPATVADDLAGLGPPPTLVENPRRGRGGPAFDGLCCGMAAGYRFVAKTFPGAHAWKIDTDAYVIGPCRRRIADYFDARPTVGLAGTLDVDCDGTPRDDAFRRLADVHRKYLWPVWYWKSLGRVTSPLIGRGRRFASWYRCYDSSGGRRGRYVQGGSYAINATLLRAWLAPGALPPAEDWLGAPFAEDLGFSLWATLAGFDLGNFNSPGEPFGVKNIGLALPPAQLVARGHGVVHSVKMPTWAEELATVAALETAVESQT